MEFLSKRGNIGTFKEKKKRAAEEARLRDGFTCCSENPGFLCASGHLLAYCLDQLPPAGPPSTVRAKLLNASMALFCASGQP